MNDTQPVEVHCDFDGTVTKQDVTDTLLQSLADPAWEEIEEQWERGEIGSLECMERQVCLVRGGWQAVTKVLDTIEIDDTFSTFAQWCKSQGIKLQVVSDGVDRVIEYILYKHNIEVDSIKSNHLTIGNDGSFSLSFPYASTRCDSGICKCEILDCSKSPLKIVIGDGKSDFCWSQHADILFAKKRLATNCEESKRDFTPFNTFADVLARLQARLVA